METGNKIGNEGVKALCEMLKVNTRLDYLYLNSEGKRQIISYPWDQGKSFS